MFHDEQCGRFLLLFLKIYGRLFFFKLLGRIYPFLSGVTFIKETANSSYSFYSYCFMSDINYRAYAAERDIFLENERIYPDNPLSYSDILKFSNCSNVLVKDCQIVGGKEECVDIVRGDDYVLQGLVLEPKGQAAIVIKGAVVNYKIIDCEFLSHGKKQDIELGQFDNYWTFGRKPTRGGAIVNVRARDGKPVKVVLWDAEKPEIINSNVKIVKMPKIVVLGYFIFRAIYIKLFGKP